MTSGVVGQKSIPHNLVTLHTIRYDTIESLTWTRKLSIQLYLAHVARKKTKTNNASAPLIQYRLRSVKSVRKE